MAASELPWELSDEAFEAQYQAAAQRGNESLRSEPHAASITFDAGSRRFLLTLTNGTSIGFTAGDLPVLDGMSEEELADSRVLGVGSGIGWASRDVHVSVPGLVLALTFGPTWRKTMRGYLNAELAGIKSEAKAEAARKNGAKGGRPRKQIAEPAPSVSASRKRSH